MAKASKKGIKSESYRLNQHMASVTAIKTDKPTKKRFKGHFGESVEQDLSSVPPRIRPRLIRQTATKERLGFVTDIDCLGNNQLIIVTSHKVFVYNEKGQEIPHSISRASEVNSNKGYLRGVSVNKNKSKMVMTEYRCDDEDGYLHVYLKENDVWSHDKRVTSRQPERVHFMSSDEFLVSCADNSSIYKYDRQCRKVACIKLPSFPRGFCANSTNMIFVCVEHGVCVYDEKGTKISSPKTEKDKLVLTDICVSHNDDLLVCDYQSKSILVYTNTGTFKETLLTLDNSPYKISLFGDKHFAVCDLSGHLSLYEL